jgi:non-ribosomal peptide synthase protein (TIGR01720 family)
VAAGGFDGELDHWAGPPAEPAAGPAPVDDAEPAPLRSVSVALSAEDTDVLLRVAPGVYRTRINDVLLAALARALSARTGRDQVRILLEGHGREDLFDGVDLSRTVGWFTTMYPVTLQVPAGADQEWRGLVKSVRRQLRAVPGNGLGYGALRHLGDAAVRERLAAAERGPQVVFNYLGQWDARSAEAAATLYHAAHPAPGRDHDPRNRRARALEVVGSVHGGELEFTWYHPAGDHDEATVAELAGAFADALRGIVADCQGYR